MVEQSAAPRPTLSLLDGMVMVVGMVVGVGIFAAPSLVAQFAGSEFNYLALWLVGGLLTLNGALCYAELCTRLPSAGGEYHFLSHAYGRSVAILFAWARCSVIQTGSIAFVSFIYGDYAQSVVPLGAYGAAIHAAIAIIVFTAINIAGTLQGKTAQKLFTSLDIIALFLLIAVGVMLWGSPAAAAPAPSAGGGGPTLIGLGMVFVLLTYGGWNEAAYLSAELKDERRNIVRILAYSIVAVTALYFLVAYIYLRTVGFDALRDSSAIATDVMRLAFGPAGGAVIAVLICGSAISTLNATIFTGGRIYYELGKDLPMLRYFGLWDAKGENPAHAFLLQGVVALGLVLVGALSRNGFRAMVEYTAPVFWLFMTLVSVSLFVFRYRKEGEAGAYRVPLYPMTPVIFAATCLYMLYSSATYALGQDALTATLLGLGVLLAGVPLLFFKSPSATAE
ncbi:MAG TPA: amino acid permease [Rhizomicrobium sp.]|nr:amino acid permease [Rhizomicrobium sp.]